MTQPATSPKKFAFDTEFDSGVANQPAPAKRYFTNDEVERLTQKAADEAEARTLASIHGRTADALEEIARQTRAGMSALARVAHEHREGSAALALACGRTIAGVALEQFPHAPVAAALETLARELESSPRLVVRVAPQALEAVQAALDETATQIGFTGQIRCQADAALPSAAFSFDWGDGRAAFDPVTASERIGEALTAALAAEGLHGEALNSTEAQGG